MSILNEVDEALAPNIAKTGYLFKVYSEHFNGKVNIKLWLQVVFTVAESGENQVMLTGHSVASNATRPVRRHLWGAMTKLLKRRLKGYKVVPTKYDGRHPSNAQALRIVVTKA